MRPSCFGVSAVFIRVLTFLVAAEASAADPKPTAESVRITYRWRGLGAPHDEVYDIARAGADFKANVAVTNGEFGPFGAKSTVERSTFIVPAAAMQALFEALRAPSMTQAEGIAALTGRDWLRENVAAAYQTVTAQPCSDKARDLFFGRFQDSSAARHAFVGYFSGWWTDDYPSAEIEAQLSQIGSIERTTGSQKAFMLPWQNAGRQDWNPTLPRAIAALLPETSAGRGRLAGRDIVSQLADEILREIKDQWEDLELRCTFRDLIAKLAPHYEVVGIYGTSNKFAGYLQGRDTPVNLAINVVLPADSPTIAREEVEALLKLGPVYAKQVRAFVIAHPETKFTIWYSERHSFDEGDLDIRREAKSERIRPIARDCVMLVEHDYFYGRRWVVLPSGEVMEWSQRPSYDTRRPGPGW